MIFCWLQASCGCYWPRECRGYTPAQIKTNRYQQTSAKHIFAIGDCAGPYHYTHAAAYQGQVVAHNIVHPKTPVVASYKAIPRTIFTNPQVASTGMTGKQAKDSGVAYKASSVPISLVAKSATSGFTDGFVKIIASQQSNVILGATIVCPEASELIGELSLAIQYSLTAEQVAHTVHSFGTWSEGLRVACAKLARIV
jgi:dihydrolipoamide dehydrogenase